MGEALWSRPIALFNPFFLYSIDLDSSAVRLWIATSDYRDASTKSINTHFYWGTRRLLYSASPLVPVYKWISFLFDSLLCVCACAGALVLAVGLASYSSVSQLSHTYVYIHQHTRYREINPKPRGSLVSLSTRICVQCSSSEQCQRIDEYDTPRFVREERGWGVVCIYWMYIDRGKESSFFLSTFRCQPTPPMKRTSSEKRKYKI